MTATIIPQHVAYPHTFTALLHYRHTDGRWVVDKQASDVALNTQMVAFLKENAHAVLQVSAPSVSIYQEDAYHRIYMTGVSILYTPQAEGIEDEERNIDEVGTVPGDAVPAGPSPDIPSDG